jgi:hypothetical protein
MQGANSVPFFSASLRPALVSNFAAIVGFNRPDNRRDNLYGKEMFRDGIGGVGIRVWNCSALERRYRYDRALPRSGAQLQLCAATTAAPCVLRSASASSLRRRNRPGLWLLRAAVRILRFTPVLRPPRLLAREPSSLALTKICVEAAVSAATQVKRSRSQRIACSDSVLISGNPDCFSC